MRKSHFSTTPFLISLVALLAISVDFANPFESCGNPPNFPRSRNEGSNVKDGSISTDALKLDKASIGFIINGTEVRRGEIPWVVGITKYQPRKRPRWKVVCGGALINERFILTASHCLDGRYKETLEVVLNLDDQTIVEKDPLILRKKVKRFILHPEYNSRTVDNDIALIEMDKPIISLDMNDTDKNTYKLPKLPENLWPICLPEKEGQDYDNSIGQVAGWGYTEFNDGKGNSSSKLRRTYIPILSREDCLTKTLLPAKGNVTLNMICAGYVDEGGKDSCINDSGGPLTIEENGINYIVGIISWGIGCGLKGYPGVYTKVSNYIPWIKSNIA